jgi:hypothetical protein
MVYDQNSKLLIKKPSKSRRWIFKVERQFVCESINHCPIIFERKNMDNNIKVSELLQSASDVWKFLKEEGGLNTNLYDADLVEELRVRLSVSNRYSFEEVLKNTSTEDFIAAFFQTVQPYDV